MKYFYVSVILCMFIVLFGASGKALATSPPGVVDIFVNSSAFVYSDTYDTQTPFIPSAGITKTVYINGHVTDGDGVGTGFGDGDLASVDLHLYRETVGSSCQPDNNDCYLVSCTVTPNSSTVLNYSCLAELSYIIDATTAGSDYPNEAWNAEVIVVDDTAQIASSIKQFEVDSLLSIDIPNTIDFGGRIREEITTAQTNTEYILTQFGNVAASVLVSGTGMTCSVIGSIPAASLSWALTDVGGEDPSVTAVNSTPTNTSLVVSTDDDQGLVGLLYFNIQLPSVVSGSCTGSMTIEVTAS